MILKYHYEAAKELDEAFEWYESQKIDLEVSFYK